MSDERTASRRDAQIAEAVAEIAAPAESGTLRLAETALHSPAPPPEAEAAARHRALSAFEESRLTPRALHSVPWGGGASPSPLAALLARLVRRLWGR